MITNADRVPTAPHVTTIPDLTLGLADTIWRLGPVQEIPIVIDQPTPCLEPAGADKPFGSGTGTTVIGSLQGSIQRTGSFWGIDGPHTSQVWPLVGEFPTSLPGIAGLFTGISGLQGTWSVPAVLHKQISGGSLTARATVDVAIPPLSDTSKVVWDSATPIRATARVTNIDDMEQWQSWLVGSGVFLGIGASLLASLLFEWLRRAREASTTGLMTTTDLNTDVGETEPPSHEPLPTSAPRRATTLVTIGILTIVAYVLGRTRR
ncbi:hypothetical protein [Amycolatopsis sp. H20-H5]|uniref:hypothetical protein n=1 Tax=Amycolatopsis sp. H20-H5 TaxID=3046309 RepID=UPI002DB72753|nr:hypothetical protein [Amycolatopsis sp. H20-H5]MEC3978724.1 hypothetical protein [Amycolatopsis sp. H20-H5]